MPSDPRTTVISDAMLGLLQGISGSAYHFTDYAVREFKGQEPKLLPLLEFHFLGSTSTERRTAFGGSDSYRPTLRLGVTGWCADIDNPRLAAQRLEMDVKTALMSTSAMVVLSPSIEIIEWGGTSVTIVSAEKSGAARVEIAFDVQYFEAVGNPSKEGV